MSNDTIDYYFSIASPWAFLGLDDLTQIAARHGKTITPHPIVIIADNGAIFGRDRPAPRRSYGLRDLERWSDLRKLPLHIYGRPALADAAPAALSVIAAVLDGADWLPLTRALQSAFWQQAADIGQPEVRRAIADAAGYDGARLLAREGDADVQARWHDNITEATARGVFGSPTYAYEGELYWGQDNLHFLDQHLGGRPAPYTTKG